MDSELVTVPSLRPALLDAEERLLPAPTAVPWSLRPTTTGATGACCSAPASSRSCARGARRSPRRTSAMDLAAVAGSMRRRRLDTALRRTDSAAAAAIVAVDVDADPPRDRHAAGHCSGRCIRRRAYRVRVKELRLIDGTRIERCTEHDDPHHRRPASACQRAALSPPPPRRVSVAILEQGPSAVRSHSVAAAGEINAAISALPTTGARTPGHGEGL